VVSKAQGMPSKKTQTFKGFTAHKPRDPIDLKYQPFSE
jgi:hypothetical protein